MNPSNPRSRLALADASDSVLAARTADGDTAAFEILARRHGGLMRAYAVRMLGSNAESDDVVQESFVVAWQRIGELADGASVRSWLMRIVTNKAIDRMRVRKQHLDIDDWDAPAPQSRAPEHVVEVAMQIDALSSALQRIPEQQRRCWIMKEVGGASYAEIADDLELPVSTVRGQLARARQSLVTEMEGWR